MESYLKEEEFKELVSIFTNYIAINPDILNDNIILNNYLVHKKIPLKYDYIIKKENNSYIINIRQKAKEFNMDSSKETINTLAVQIMKYKQEENNNKNILIECIIIFDKELKRIVDVVDYEIYDSYYKKNR